MIFIDGSSVAYTAISTTKNGTAKSVKRSSNFSLQINMAVSSPSGASVQLQKSNDGVNFVNDGSSQSVTVAATFWLIPSAINVVAVYWRVVYTISTGTMTPTEQWAFFG